MELTFFVNIEKNFFKSFEKKISGQIKTFNNSGYKTELYVEYSLSFKKYINFLLKILFCKSKHIFIRSVGSRCILMLPIIIIKRLMGKKIILEVPTPFSIVIHENIMNKNKKLSDFFYIILNLFFGFLFLNCFTKIIGYVPENFPFNILIKNKFILETNSYDVNEINHINKLNKINEELNIVMVGSIAPWHGLERIIKSIKLYQKTSDSIKINLYIVGYIDVNYKEHLSLYIKKNNIDLQINYTGSLYGASLFNLYENMHIGLGSLGLKNIKVAIRSELKIREYTSVGLPFIMEAEDKNFTADLPFLFKVPYGDCLLNFVDIINWYNKLDLKISLNMRKFAVDNLDFSTKRFEYFK